MGFNFTLTDAAAKYGLDFFNLVGTSSIFGVLQDAQASYAHPTVPQGSFSVLREPSSMEGYAGYTLMTSFLSTGSGNFSLARYQVTRDDTGEVLVLGTGSLATGSVAFQALADANNLLAGDDSLTGNAGNNQLRGYAGINTVDGGAGLDTLLMPSARTNYTVTKTAGGLFIQAGNGNTTTTSVERLQFADQTVAFDTDGAAGQAYRLYQAAFNRTPDQAGLGYHIHNLDGGTSLHDVAQQFVSSNEFSFTYGPLSNTQFATQLYANMLHRAPDADGLAYQVGALDAGVSRGDVLIGFSESPENKAALIGVISNGMTFTG